MFFSHSDITKYLMYILHVSMFLKVNLSLVTYLRVPQNRVIMTDLVKFHRSHTNYLKNYSHHLKTKDWLTQLSVNTVPCKPIASVVCPQHVVKNIDPYSICFIRRHLVRLSCV